MCRLVQPVRVVEDRLIHEKDLEIIGYLSEEKCLWEHEGDYDTPEKFKEELGKKRAATTRLSGTVLPTTPFKPVHGYKVSLQAVQQIVQC